MFTLPEYVKNLKLELRRLRVHFARLNRSTGDLREKAERLKQENDRLKQENRQLVKQRDRLKREQKQLEEEIARLSKANNRYRVALFDHGNFKSPAQEVKKAKGGQPGHPDTNREQKENPLSFARKRVFASVCPDCGQRLRRVDSVRRKTLIDIVLNPQAVKLLIESERQWCRHCRKQVTAKDCRSLPFTEYGINTFMMALLLRCRCLLPLAKISQVLKTGYGLDISSSGLVSLFRQAKTYLNTRYEDLKTVVRKGELMYADETGWQVRGKNAWMWIMAGDKTTVYLAAESRGKGIAQDLYANSRAYAMHDGYAAYAKTIPKDRHLYCWAHLLRFCFEETADKPPGHEALRLRDELVSLYRLKQEPGYGDNLKLLEEEADRRIDRLLNLQSGDPAAGAILYRLRYQRDGLIRSLIVSPNGTNNLAEQELRPIALARKISFGSDTYAGMETMAILASVVQTLYRTNRDQFFPLLEASLRAGFGKP